MIELIGLSGSLRAASTNTRLLEAAAMLSPAGVRLEIVPTPGELPHFNPDRSIDGSPSLIRFVDAIRESDGLLLSSPVYAGGYPGTLKNALDWLVGTDAFVEKPFAMLSASNRVPGVQETLVRVLETMSGTHVTAASCVVPLLGKHLTASEIAADPAYAGVIRASLTRFIEHLTKPVESTAD